MIHPRLALRVAVVAAAVALALGNFAWAHKFYASLAQVEHTTDNRLEVSIRFFPDDLEAALRKSAGRTIAIENTKAFAAAFEPWLNAAFLVQAGRRTSAFRYVGLEAQVEVVWVYVEAPWVESLERSSMRNALLVDLFPEQKNTVNFVEGKKRSSVVFSADRPRVEKALTSPTPDEKP
ncbi:MAG: DUF6702 family protein [Vicinamibacteria bacterium]